MADAEALLLVDDDEAEVLELDVLLQQAVRADDDVDARPSARPATIVALLLVAAEAGEHLDAHREAGEALAEGVEVLLREDGRRHEDGDLLAVHRRP